jgi:hypothetical protein
LSLTMKSVFAFRKADCEKRITKESGFCKNRFFKKRILQSAFLKSGF